MLAPERHLAPEVRIGLPVDPGLMAVAEAKAPNDRPNPASVRRQEGAAETESPAALSEDPSVDGWRHARGRPMGAPRPAVVEGGGVQVAQRPLPAMEGTPSMPMAQQQRWRALLADVAQRTDADLADVAQDLVVQLASEQKASL